MKKKIFIGLVSVLGITSLYFGLRNQARAQEEPQGVALGNVEAFQTSESLNCEYKRKQNACEISVSAGMKLYIFNKGIIEPKADGLISIDGQVTCSANGEDACTPIECKDLYQVLIEH